MLAAVTLGRPAAGVAGAHGPKLVEVVARRHLLLLLGIAASLLRPALTRETPGPAGHHLAGVRAGRVVLRLLLIHPVLSLLLLAPGLLAGPLIAEAAKISEAVEARKVVAEEIGKVLHGEELVRDAVIVVVCVRRGVSR